MNNRKGKGKKLLIYTNSFRHVTNVSGESRNEFKCSKYAQKKKQTNKNKKRKKKCEG